MIISWGCFVFLLLWRLLDMSILRVLLSAILWNITRLIDTFLTSKLKSKQDSGELHNSLWSLMIIWWGIAWWVALLLAMFYFNRLLYSSYMDICMLLFSWVLYWISVFPYFKALHYEKVENIAPLRQLTPVFIYIFGFIFLHEYLSVGKIFLMIGIILVSLLFWRNHETKKFNIQGLSFMFISVLLCVFASVLFKLEILKVFE